MVQFYFYQGVLVIRFYFKYNSVFITKKIEFEKSLNENRNLWKKAQWQPSPQTHKWTAAIFLE